jgi:hypothetical protein
MATRSIDLNQKNVTMMYIKNINLEGHNIYDPYNKGIDDRDITTHRDRCAILREIW